MRISLKKYDIEDNEIIVDILSNNQWNYHGMVSMDKAYCRGLFKRAYFSGKELQTFLIQKNDINQTVGYIRIFDLGDDYESTDTPLFDIRIIETQRSKGIGKIVVKKAVDYIFDTYPNKNRIEATTRIDNEGMRKVLLKCYFVKEAHYRESWKSASGKLFDTIGYGILRSDWENRKVTPLDWLD